MAVNLPLPNKDELKPIAGLKLGIAEAGIKRANRKDILVIRLVPGSSVSGVFTQNRFCAAPVQLCRAHLLERNPIEALIINTGNANAGTGNEGLRRAQQTCDALAHALGISAEQVLPFSTGVILEPLPVEKIITAIPKAISALKEDDWYSAAEAIMTTDTQPKAASLTIQTSAGPIVMTGISKGAGMIQPNMATMLGFIGADVNINSDLLQDLTREAADLSFNAITIDGDTSTNDSVVLVATGASGVTIDEESFDSFLENLCQVFTDLAQAIIRDAEGSTKFVSVVVDTASNQSEALKVAYTIAESPLVKTALSASDPNWGRILAAIGRSGIEDLDVNEVQILLNSVLIADHGARAPSYSEEAGQAAMQPEDIEIRVCLNRGDASEVVWTSDLTHEYVRINAEYRT